MFMFAIGGGEPSLLLLAIRWALCLGGRNKDIGQRVTTHRRVLLLPLALVVFISVGILGLDNGGQGKLSLAAEPGDCISPTPAGCYGHPKLPEKLTPENVTLVPDPVYGGTHGSPGSSGVSSALGFGRSKVTGKPVVPISVASVINKGIEQLEERFNSLNEDIVAPSERRCSMKKKVTVYADTATGLSKSVESEVKVCN